MANEIPDNLTVPRNLFLDRKKAKYCFLAGPDQVLMSEAGKRITLSELRLLFHPYGNVQIRRDEEMFDEDVLRWIRGSEVRAPGPTSENSAPAAPRASSPATAPPRAPKAAPPPRAPAATAAPRAQGPPPAAVRQEPPGRPVPAPPAPRREASLAARAPPPPPSPAQKVATLRSDLHEKVFDRIRSSEGKAAVLSGRLDGDIRGLVGEIGREVTPRQILAAPPEPQRDDADFFADHTMTSQAFGTHLALGQSDLFLVAKSAILQSLTEADRKNIQAIKQSLLLGKPSAHFEKRLSQYYQEIAKYLRVHKTDPAIVDLIFRSKYIFFEEALEALPPPSLALGVTDAFVTLREAGKLTLEILGILPARLKRLLPPGAAPVLSSIEGLLRESCYNEYRQAIDGRLSGGDHCDFFSITPKRFGIMIFDVSGHERRASELRDVLVRAIPRVAERGDPARLVTALNRFVLQYPFPEDVFVSMVYGVIDVEENLFTYANAGHHPPYLVRKDMLRRLEAAGGVALNMMDEEYRNGSTGLETLDSLVLYTDGLTEAVQAGREPGRKELFGNQRLESAIVSRKLGAMKARRAVEQILSAVRDQGFQIQDDITVQVYRHV